MAKDGTKKDTIVVGHFRPKSNRADVAQADVSSAAPKMNTARAVAAAKLARGQSLLARVRREAETKTNKPELEGNEKEKVAPHANVHDELKDEKTGE